MSDFVTMRTRIAEEMQRGDLSSGTTAVGSAIVSAIKRLERRRFYWNEFNGASNSISTSFMTLASLSAKIGGRPIILDTVKVVIGPRDYMLLRRTWKELEEIDSGQWQGYPEYYAVHGGSIRFYPPPLDTFETRISGVKSLDEIASAGSSDDASNAWVVDGEEMTRQLAKSILWADVYHDAQAADYFEARSQRAYRELRREIVAKQAAGRIRPTIF